MEVEALLGIEDVAASIPTELAAGVVAAGIIGVKHVCSGGVLVAGGCQGGCTVPRTALTGKAVVRLATSSAPGIWTDDR